MPVLQHEFDVKQKAGVTAAIETTGYAAAPRVHVRRWRPQRLLAHAALLLICVTFILPFIWMLATSVKPLSQTMEFPPTFIPREFLPENYLRVLDNPKMQFMKYARNTLLIAALCVIGTTLSSAVVAYGFAKIDFKGRNVLFAIMLATMMIPFPVTMVSMFSIWKWLGDTTGIPFLGTFKPLWLTAWFGSAFNIFLLRQFFMTIPKELSEAARIDGCSEWGIFWRVVMPLARPALAVVALFTFMGVWNDYIGPAVYLQNPEFYTLALGLQAFQTQHGGTEWNLLMAASLMVIAPIIVLFFLTQKTFIQGIATTGIK